MVNKAPRNQNNTQAFLKDYFNLVLAGILIIFLLGAYLIVLRPKIKSTQRAVQENIEMQIRLYNSSQTKLANLKMIDSLYKKINATDLQRFNGVLPDYYARESLYGELETIVGQGGWVIKSIKISPPEDDTLATPSMILGGASGSSEDISVVDTTEDGTVETAASSSEGAADENQIFDSHLGRITVDMSVQGIDYQGFKKLLKMLETNLRLFDVIGVETAFVNDSANVTLVTYYYRPLK
jgi:hypothetical protein